MSTPLSRPSPMAARHEDALKHNSETKMRRPSPSRRNASSKGESARCCFQRNCMLVVIGALAVCSMILSLALGHYWHIRYADGIISMASSSPSLQSKLQHFLSGEGANGKTRGGEQREIIDSANHDIIDSKHERSVFESIINRVNWTKDQCDSVPSDQKNTVKKELKAATDLQMLPEGGVAPALERWLKENPPLSAKSDYPICYLPPPKSCNVTTYTLIIMSHTTERLQTFMDPLSSMVESWPGLTEIIIVWNSPREMLTAAAKNGSVEGKKINGKEQEYADKLLQWHEDASHPLRIFFSLENGLSNNLLNRYHPKLKPKNEAVMYFDDDGPFWSREAMVYGGFELWKRNSNVQVGGFPRNIRFLSDRMKLLEKANLQQSIDIVVKDVDGYSGESHPTFTPLCRNVTGDHVEYNYFTFPDFAGHVLLPSGTFLHRNFLCFIWHPAFEELRQWVVSHKTMPDDMTVSTLVSHLSGRAPRTFPREVSVRRRLSSIDDMHTASLQKVNADRVILQSPQPDQMHRRLLWKQKNWGGMREEAINSILGYFGSIHPGTVGWCASTPYMKNNNRGVPFVCHPDKPTLDLLPWLSEGGAGSDQCPLDVEVLKQAEMLSKKEDDLDQSLFEDLCQECKYKGLGITCRQRMQYLIDNYSTDPIDAKSAVLKEDASCKR